ncbi:MAG: antibiotic biosynthesis monooxygenase [Ruminococcus sp.]|nr:antibiotic biosynthesis monooxygenase [Ruminococcus sp.]
MAITVNIYYSGINGNARKFAEEMISSGIVEQIRGEKGNLRYDYFLPMGDDETVLLIDSWENQTAIDEHHHSPTMSRIIELREKYDLHMKVERYSDDLSMPQRDKDFIRD